MHKLKKSPYFCAYNENKYLCGIGKLSSFGIQQPKEGELKVSSAKIYKRLNEQIINAKALKPGVVIETYDKVLLLARNKWYKLINEQALTVRTFARSRRFQNIVAVTTGRGIYIIGIFDAPALERSESEAYS